MRGRAIPLSAPRRLVGDLMWFSIRVSRVTVQRRMNLAPLAAARRGLSRRPPWTALFTKAYSVLAQETAELRRAYVTLPWPMLYEYPESVAALASSATIAAKMPCCRRGSRRRRAAPSPSLSDLIREAQLKPVLEVKDFRLALTMARAPAPNRRLIMWLGL